VETGVTAVDSNHAGVAGAELTWRPLRKSKRSLIMWGDLGIAIWLSVGLLVAPLPRVYRWKVCTLASLFSGWTSRALHARLRIVRMVNMSDVAAARAVRKLYAGRFASYLDVVRGLLLTPDVNVACKGLAGLDAIQAQGRGVVLWISDFISAGDVSKLALARAGRRLVHLSRPQHGFTTSAFGIRFLNPLRIKFECAYLAERVVFDRMNPERATTRLLDVLRAGGLVSVMASAHEGRALADLPFLGGRIKLAAGALRLARKSGAAVIPVFVLGESERRDSFEVVFAPPLDVSREQPETEVLLAVASAYRDQLETVVRNHPESWVGWRRADQVSMPS
jgi:lauroyl/myristoyl acyltransferase